MATADGPKGPAMRIAPEQWAKYRAIIGEKYAKENLQDLMKKMQEEHGFVATKRQYVHQLDKWGMFKYKSSARTRAPQRPAPPPEPASTSSHSATPEAEEPHPDASALPPTFPFAAWMLTKNGPPPRTAFVAEPLFPTLRDEAETPKSISPQKRQKEDDHVPENLSPGVGILTCPYRRRNPRRFNVRDHQSCAMGVFTDMAQVKLHVRTNHLTSWHNLKCPRCQRVFLTLKDVGAHLAVPTSQICDLAPDDMPVDPEDGINFEVERSLRGSMKETGNIIKLWNALWRELFPQDTRVLPPYFEAPVEHFELWDFILKDFPKRAVLEFVSRADLAKQAEIEERLHNVLTKTLEAFPGPTFMIAGHSFENPTTGTAGSRHETNTNPSSAAASQPDGDQWTGDDREVEPWLGWFKPPGAITRPSHLAHRRAL
ncbi:hypothetical protein QBC34DRAFT_444342 [Podospora aff. communis PSN243]|uniref:Clr5 domain-containing protein n=1 Tax=Podospora aff. communis PSN243 TaxID=3040156 RepID=A0AAV9G134_9PEZI|nr:hypothetical protein QBC34DRAFT_444342 [Podospora aff. communis PSN243]